MITGKTSEEYAKHITNIGIHEDNLLELARKYVHGLEAFSQDIEGKIIEIMRAIADHKDSSTPPVAKISAEEAYWLVHGLYVWIEEESPTYGGPRLYSERTF
ncbi:MAG: hypothetical protein ACYSWP_12855 [Planctomycetota bacterium]|jgi:hypothetical protein